jgi:hypothetical protein
VSASAGSTTAAEPAVPSAPAAAADKPSGALQHAEDTAIASCARDATTGWGTVRVQIVNHSSKPSNYVVSVAFESADGSRQYGSALIAANDLRPGQTTIQESSSLADAPAGVKCRLTDVTRYAA